MTSHQPKTWISDHKLCSVKNCGVIVRPDQSMCPKCVFFKGLAKRENKSSKKRKLEESTSTNGDNTLQRDEAIRNLALHGGFIQPQSRNDAMPPHQGTQHGPLPSPDISPLQTTRRNPYPVVSSVPVNHNSTYLTHNTHKTPEIRVCQVEGCYKILPSSQPSPVCWACWKRQTGGETVSLSSSTNAPGASTCFRPSCTNPRPNTAVLFCNACSSATPSPGMPASEREKAQPQPRVKGWRPLPPRGLANIRIASSGHGSADLLPTQSGTSQSVSSSPMMRNFMGSPEEESVPVRISNSRQIGEGHTLAEANEHLSTSLAPEFNANDAENPGTISSDVMDIESEDMQLEYPPEPNAMESVPSSSISESKTISTSQAAPSKPTVRTPIGNWTTSSTPLPQPQKRKTVLRLCSAPDCSEILDSESTSEQCFTCIRSRWKTGLGKGTPRILSSSSIMKRRSKIFPSIKQEKRVSWADGGQIGSFEKIKNEGGATGVESPDDPPSSREEPVRREDRKFPLPSAQVVASTSAQPTETVMHDTNKPSVDASVSSTLVSNSTPVSGWDSDLTDLSDLTAEEDETSSDDSEMTESDPDNPMISTGFKIRIPAQPMQSNIVIERRCSIAKCKKLLPTDYTWKCCPECREATRNYQRKRLGVSMDLEPPDHEQGPKCSPRVKLLLPGATVVSPRKCTIRGCPRVIPPVSEYKFKMCESCRERPPDPSSEIEKDIESEEETEYTKPSSSPSQAYPSPSPELEEPQTEPHERNSSPELSYPPPDAMASHLSNMVANAFQPQVPLKRKRGRPQKYNYPITQLPSPSPSPAKPRISVTIPPSKSSTHSIRSRSTSIRRPRDPTPYPEYQCFRDLISKFRERLSCFLRAQATYYFLRSPEGIPPEASQFSFDGEFSKVASDFNIGKRMDEITKAVDDGKEEIERIGGLYFSPTRWVSVLDIGGVVTRFSCFYNAPMSFPGSPTTPSTPVDQNLVKKMRGELEIAVLPDGSHPFFPGQRTVVRFRLLG